MLLLKLISYNLILKLETKIKGSKIFETILKEKLKRIRSFEKFKNIMGTKMKINFTSTPPT